MELKIPVLSIKVCFMQCIVLSERKGGMFFEIERYQNLVCFGGCLVPLSDSVFCVYGEIETVVSCGLFAVSDGGECFLYVCDQTDHTPDV